MLTITERPKQYNHFSSFEEDDGVDVHAQPPAEKRPALVLLHGLFGKGEDWQNVARRLAPSWRVFTPDLPVLESGQGGCCVEGMSKHVLGLLDEAGVEKAILVGNSLGGHLALLIALNSPERVAALVLAGSSGLYERSFTPNVPHRPDRNWLRVRIAEVFHSPRHVTEQLIDEVERTLADRARAIRMVRLAKSAKRHNLSSRLSEIRCPSYLIWGECDRITPPRMAAEFHNGLPNAELHFIPECGHSPGIEQPEIFHRILEGCLGRLPSMPAAA